MIYKYIRERYNLSIISPVNYSFKFPQTVGLYWKTSYEIAITVARLTWTNETL